MHVGCLGFCERGETGFGTAADHQRNPGILPDPIVFFENYSTGMLTIGPGLWCNAVFRIYDILVWIRIRGSMPLTNVSGSCYFRH